MKLPDVETKDKNVLKNCAKDECLYKSDNNEYKNDKNTDTSDLFRDDSEDSIKNDEESSTYDEKLDEALKNEEKARDKEEFKKALIGFAIKLAVIAVACWVLFFVVFGVGFETGTGMEPRVKQGDILLYFRLEKDYRLDECVTLTLGNEVPEGWNTNIKWNGQRVSARILALAGDVISFVTIDSDSSYVKGGNQYTRDTVQILVNGNVKATVQCTDVDLAEIFGDEFELEDGECFLINDSMLCDPEHPFGRYKQSSLDGSVFTLIRKSGI